MVITHSMEACHTQRLATNSQCQDPALTQTWSEAVILRIFFVCLGYISYKSWANS